MCGAVGYGPAPNNDAEARFEFAVKEAGDYEVRLIYQHHENRSTKTSVTVQSAGGEMGFIVNQREKAPLENSSKSLGTFRFEPGKPGAVIVRAKGADGNASADAVHVLKVY